jgi:hypothetical protein
VLHELESRVGFEIELLAPRGATRADLACAVAAAVGGEVALAFHRDSEPSAVPGMGAFHHLTPRGRDWCTNRHFTVPARSTIVKIAYSRERR